MNERLERYKAAAYERAFAQHSPKEANYTQAFFETHADMPFPERYARSFAHALVNEPVYIHPDERLAGQIWQGSCAGSGAINLWGGDDPRWNDFAAGRVAARLTNERLPENAAYAKYFNGGA
ncbi:MAG: hypothetical protein GXP25_10410, partial [Planctomycetes bacterium]|nr:hypothetical protein [Planctomycetota bacterium]